MKTIAQQLNIKDFPFKIKDSNGNTIYYENFDGYWSKSEYDNDGNQIYYYENSEGFWYKYNYDSNGNVIYYENSDGYWNKFEYNNDGIQIYYEDSNGNILDKRKPEKVELTMDEIAEKFNIDVEKLKIKKQ